MWQAKTRRVSTLGGAKQKEKGGGKEGSTNRKTQKGKHTTSKQHSKKRNNPGGQPHSENSPQPKGFQKNRSLPARRGGALFSRRCRQGDTTKRHPKPAAAARASQQTHPRHGALGPPDPCTSQKPPGRQGITSIDYLGTARFPSPFPPWRALSHSACGGLPWGAHDLRR